MKAADIWLPPYSKTASKVSFTYYHYRPTHHRTIVPTSSLHIIEARKLLSTFTSDNLHVPWDSVIPGDILQIDVLSYSNQSNLSTVSRYRLSNQ